MSDNYWVLGKQSVFEIIKNNKKKIVEIAIEEAKRKELPKFFNTNKIKIKDKKFFTKIKEADFPDQGYAICIEREQEKDIEEYLDAINNFIVLDNINDPRNIGSIIRTCVAMNMPNIIVEKKFFKHSNQLINKTASGATEYANIFRVTNIGTTLRYLIKKNYQIYGFDSNKTAETITSKFWSTHNAFVFGAEDEGIKYNNKKLIDKLMKIKTSPNMESLNVSNSVAAFLSIFNLLQN
jgi:tRNA G18 (ribose-2'-O)-methylase SpoU